MENFGELKKVTDFGDLMCYYGTRHTTRIPYADWQSQSESSDSNSDSDDFVPTADPFPSSSRGRNSKYKSDDYDDNDAYFAKQKSSKSTRRQPKSDVNMISSRTCLGSRIRPSDPECRVGPDGKECRFIPFSELEPDLLNLEKILKPGETGISTLLPSYDPVAKNKIQFFGKDDSIQSFQFRELSTLTTEELYEKLAEVEEDLATIPTIPEYEKDFVLVPPYDENIKNAIVIQHDVRTLDWQILGQKTKFDVIVMDPPWNIQQAQTTRGVELGYNLMPTEQIAAMHIPEIQDDGYCFMWVVASTQQAGIAMLQGWGYKIVGYINWIKTSKYGRYQPSNGYYLQHDKETCLVGAKGRPIDGMVREEFCDTIVDERGARQSHKPPKLYTMIERMFPGCLYCEIFARAHNEREGWVSIGDEVND